MNSLPPPSEDLKSNFISDEDIITLGHYGETVLKFDNLSPHEMILISLVVRMMIGKSFYRCGCLPIDRAIRIATRLGADVKRFDHDIVLFIPPTKQ